MCIPTSKIPSAKITSGEIGGLRFWLEVTVATVRQHFFWNFEVVHHISLSAYFLQPCSSTQPRVFPRKQNVWITIHHLLSPNRGLSSPTKSGYIFFLAHEVSFRNHFNTGFQLLTISPPRPPRPPSDSALDLYRIGRVSWYAHTQLGRSNPDARVVQFLWSDC